MQTATMIASLGLLLLPHGLLAKARPKATTGETWELSLDGMNLLHPWHQEYVLGTADRIGRTVFLDARLKF